MHDSINFYMHVVVEHTPLLLERFNYNIAYLSQQSIEHQHKKHNNTYYYATSKRTVGVMSAAEILICEYRKYFLSEEMKWEDTRTIYDQTPPILLVDEDFKKASKIRRKGQNYKCFDDDITPDLLSSLNQVKLRALCKSRGLIQHGTNKQLRKRLNDYIFDITQRNSNRAM